MLSDLAFALASQGHHVTVITSRLTYATSSVRLPARETVRGVAVIRVATSGFGRDGLVGRTVDYLTFYVCAAWALVFKLRRGDIVVAKTDPPMLSVLAAPIAWIKGARQVNWLQDLFPEVAIALGFGRGRWQAGLFRLIQWLRNLSLRRADLNIVLGQRMAETVAMLGVRPERIFEISNWADDDLLCPVPASRNTLRTVWGLADRFVVGYSGNFGRAHEYRTLIEAIALLDAQGTGGSAPAPEAGEAPGSAPVAESPPIVWLFIGGGALYEAFRQEVIARNLTSVRFEPYQPREVLSDSLSAADVHLVSLRAELEGLIVPSKFYGIAAVGRPTIFIGDRDGEISRLLSRHECGVTVQEGDGEALAYAIREMAMDRNGRERMGANARRVFLSDFTKSRAIARWSDALATLASVPRP